MNKNIRNGLALAGVLVMTSANAAVDVAASVTEIGESKAAVLLVGAAVFSVALGVKLYKWIKGAL